MNFLKGFAVVGGVRCSAQSKVLRPGNRLPISFCVAARRPQSGLMRLSVKASRPR